MSQTALFHENCIICELFLLHFATNLCLFHISLLSVKKRKMEANYSVTGKEAETSVGNVPSSRTSFVNPLPFPIEITSVNEVRVERLLLDFLIHPCLTPEPSFER